MSSGPLMRTQNAASAAEPSEAPEETVNLCVFRVGQEEMALDIMRIREIMRPLPITPLPRAPLGVRGIIHVRGVVIPVVDLRERFGMPRTEEGPRQRIMVTLERRRLYGLFVDGVEEVARAPRNAITSGEEIFSGMAAQVFAGVCRHKGSMILLLNLQRLLSVEHPIAIPALPPGSPAGGA